MLNSVVPFSGQAMFCLMACGMFENTLSSYTSDQFTPFMFSNYLEDSLPAMLPVKAVLCESHSSMLAADILVYYVCTRLHWHAKSVTRNTASKKLTKNNSKKAKLCWKWCILLSPLVFLIYTVRHLTYISHTVTPILSRLFCNAIKYGQCLHELVPGVRGLAH
jgi:hypothetical protein